MTYHRARLVLLLVAAAVLLFSSAVGARGTTVRSGSFAVARAPAGAASAAPAPVAGANAVPIGDSRPGTDRGAGGSKAGTSKPSKPPASHPGTAGTATSSSATGHPYGPGGANRYTGSPSVALTFDDGPDPINTPKILDLLAQQGVKATFCLVGFRARDHPDLVRRIAAEGHTLCNHSWQHLLNLANKPADYINWDLQQTNAAIHAAAPDAEIKYFRAPGGNFTPDLVAKAKQLGMASIYWEVDPRDWDHTKDSGDGAHINRVVGSVEHNTRAGSIVLSHDNGQPDTIVAYQTLIPWLKARFTLAALPT
jgi:peptidoglycan/xylan/chitin deacetylase (PgdA/CDA1 family)